MPISPTHVTTTAVTASRRRQQRRVHRSIGITNLSSTGPSSMIQICWSHVVEPSKMMVPWSCPTLPLPKGYCVSRTKSCPARTTKVGSTTLRGRIRAIIPPPMTRAKQGKIPPTELHDAFLGGIYLTKESGTDTTKVVPIAVQR